MGRKAYTEDEDKIIRQQIHRFPTNLGIAFEQAARLIDRSAGAIGNRWRNHLKTSSIAAFAIATPAGVVINTKTVSRPKDTKTKLSAFEIAKMTVEEMSQEDMKKLIIHMIKNGT